MSKRLLLVFIGFSLLLSFHLYSAKTSDLQAAKELGLTERILGYKIKRYSISPKLLS